MLNYPKKAITIKTSPRFSYSLYSAIGLNMLKYNHDSSSVVRLVKALNDDGIYILDDLGYQPRFSLRGLDFTTIDRIRKFAINSIPDLNVRIDEVGDTFTDYIIGYSGYTRKQYTLEIVSDTDEFARHSIPCDMFLCGEIGHNLPETYELVPYMKVPIGMYSSGSQITIDVLGGISISSVDGAENVTIQIYGKDTRNEDIFEKISIVHQVEYVTENEFAFVESMVLVGNNANVRVRVCPYINGEHIMWDQNYVDRESFDPFLATIRVDQSVNSLVISKLNEYVTEYPNLPEPVEYIKLKTETEDELITTYFIDKDNKLIYLSTDKEVGLSTEKRFYCYPLMFPYRANGFLDKIKTEYQSLKIEYMFDTVNRECTFWIFPAERHNGIESLNILIKKQSDKDSYPSWNPSILYFEGDEVAFNGSLYTCITQHVSSTNFAANNWRSNTLEYSTGVLLDLYRSGIETNRIVIPFSDLFVAGSDECLVEFVTYGDGESILPIYLYERTIDPLFVKPLSDLTEPWSVTPDGVNTWLTDSDNYSFSDYVEFYASGGSGYGEGSFGGMPTVGNPTPIRFGGSTINPIESVFLYKLTNVGNICVNNTTITNVFNTFVFNEIEQTITTSDAITSLRGSAIEV